MKIPIFVSSPTTLSQRQEGSQRLILRELEHHGFEARSLGRSDYPTELPLREVLMIARHCAGAVILGFTQFRAESGILKPGSKAEKVVDAPVLFPTAWNNLEAGILFSLRLPMLVFKEDGITGGIFDHGVSDVFVHPMPHATLQTSEKRALRSLISKWQASVRNFYYN
jgi:hypothetical protein